MARLVRHEKTGPYRIDPADFPKDGKAMWICGCGLSSTMPYCDKSHNFCRTEQPGRLYRYDPVSKQVIEEREDPHAAPAAAAEHPEAPLPPPDAMH